MACLRPDVDGAKLLVMRSPCSTRHAAQMREWTPADDAFVARLADEAFGEFAAKPSRYLTSLPRRATTRTWIALHAGVPIGLVVVELTAREAAVLAVAVSAGARARGVGGQLMQVAERCALAHGARRLTLFTADSNLAALDLFLRRGFRIIARKPGFYSRGQAACHMQKELRRGVG